jgi:drug/metabolite transporter (DMT)-like permease
VDSTVKTTRTQGLTFAFLAAVFAAAYDILTRFYSSGITPWQILLVRAIFGLALSVIAARTLGLNLLGRNRVGMLFIALTLVGAVLCLIFALFRLPVFEAVLLLYLYPVFGALFSPFLVNERMRPKLWGLIGVAFCGTAFILWPQNLVWSVNWGHLLAIGAGLATGLALTLVRRYSQDNSPLTPFFYFCAVGAIVSVGAALSFSTQAMEFSRADLGALVGIAITACLAQLCMIKSAACITSAEVGIIGMSEIVFGGLLSFLFFDEPVGLRQLWGGILVISSGVALALDTSQNAAPRG